LLNPAFSAAWIVQGGADLVVLLQTTGPVTRIVVALLLVASVASWGVILSKALLFRKVRRESDTFWRIFRKANSLSEVGTACETLRVTPLVPLFDVGCELLAVRRGQDSEPQPPKRAGQLTIERTMQRAASGHLTELESRMTFLATTASAAPFVGLLGTVVGIIGSFIGLSTVSGGTTLASVGPGIADALIATAAGLFAAIPALIAYNHFVAQLRQVGGQLDDLQAEFLAIAEQNE
jgi:biopolymer transport protein TolQ